MFDKNLFYDLCRKYHVELSDSADKPMIKDKDGIHEITQKVIRQIFAPSQTFFEYSDTKTNPDIILNSYDLQEDFAVAC